MNVDHGPYMYVNRESYGRGNHRANILYSRTRRIFSTRFFATQPANEARGAGDDPVSKEQRPKRKESPHHFEGTILGRNEKSAGDTPKSQCSHLGAGFAIAA